MSKVYDAIELDVQFKEYYVEDAQTPNNRYVRARWNATLKCGDRTMILEFHTGLRDLMAPRGFDRWFGGSSFSGPTLKADNLIPLAGIKWRGSMLEETVANYLRAEFNAGRKFVLGYPKEQVEGIKKWVRPKAPTKQDILYCVASDTQMTEASSSFEEWAREFGYDEDSRKAERIYQECMKQARDFRALCGGGAQAEDCAAFTMAVDEYSYDEAKIMWGEESSMANTVYLDGKPVSRSKNLRGLIRYGHKHGVRSVTIVNTGVSAGEGAVVTVWFKNNATIRVEFVSFTVAVEFFEKRQSKWGGVIEGTGR